MVMKRWFIFLVVLFMVSMGLIGKKLATIPEVFRPFLLVIDDQQFYVTEGTTVYIFSRKDFTLKKKFGKEGEGPQEFKLVQGMPGIILIPQTDSLLINSAGKVSFYTKDGKFIKELKVTTGSMVSVFQPFGEKFVGLSTTMGENMSMNFTLNIYDAQLTKIKEIYQLPVKYMNALMPNPTAIKDNTLYQLIENEEEENWELHAHPIQ